MCSGMALAAAGTGLQIGADLQADRANRYASRLNRGVLSDAAKQEERRGIEEATRIREQGAAVGGLQRAAAAGGNVVVSQGTALKLQEDTAALASADADEARRNAMLRSWGYRTEAMTQRYERRIQSQGTKIGYFTTLLGGIKEGQQAGIFGKPAGSYG